jgi:uncharacterized protein YdiU (UPF0061 family)
MDKGVKDKLAGQLEKMEEDRTAKNIFTQEQEETRRREKPRKGWRKEVERDLQVLGVRRWREHWREALNYANPLLSNSNIVSDLHPLFQERNYGVKQELGVCQYRRCQISEYCSVHQHRRKNI